MSHFYGLEGATELQKAAAALNLPSDRRHKLLSNLNDWELKKEKSLSILLTGKTGSGKSTLVNGVLGLKIGDANAALQGGSIKASATTQVNKHQQVKNEVVVTVWDSPALQDGIENQPECIQQMKDNCSEVDLVFYCIKITETRFVRGNDNPEVVAMRRLTHAFGPGFWQKSVIILTYANLLERLNMAQWGNLSSDDKAKAFNAKVKEWEDQIKLILAKDIELPEEIVDNIRVVPAGYYREPHLLGQKYWLSNLWSQCVFTSSAKMCCCALLQVTLTRLTSDAAEIEKSLENQPLPVTDRIRGRNIDSNRQTESHYVCTAAIAVVGIAIGLRILLNEWDAVLFFGASFGALIGLMWWNEFTS